MALLMLPLTLSLLALSARGELGSMTTNALKPCINGEVSKAGMFPSQAVEYAFASDLGWTRDERLSCLIVFESVIDGDLEPGRALPTPGMAEQFEAYRRWVR